MTKELRTLYKEVFQCKDDAKKSFENCIKKIKYHKVNFDITEVIPKKKRSKNAIENPADNIHYRIHGIIEKDEASIAIAQHEKGRFILATNELDDNKLSDFDILPEYKGQSKTEIYQPYCLHKYKISFNQYTNPVMPTIAEVYFLTRLAA